MKKGVFIAKVGKVLSDFGLPPLDDGTYKGAMDRALSECSLADDLHKQLSDLIGEMSETEETP